MHDNELSLRQQEFLIVPRSVSTDKTHIIRLRRRITSSL